MSDWVKVGAEVVFSARPLFQIRSFGRVAKITKVLKNGNFRVEYSEKQFRPFGDHATATGSEWSKEQVYFLSDEVRPAVAQWHRVNAALKIVDNEIKRLTDARKTTASADDLLKIADEILNRGK